MPALTFRVEMNPYPYMAQIMRSADLCDGISVARDFVITWKKGEVIDKKRINKTKRNIKKALTKIGYECYSVKLLSKKLRKESKKCNQG